MLDQDFFGSSTVPSTGYEAPQQAQGYAQQQDEQFDFGSDAGSVQQVQNVNSGSSPNINYDYEYEQSARKVREQQEKIMSRLRDKANREYQQKNKRRQAGRAQLQQFLDKKERQTAQRKQENIQKQKRLIENNKKLSVEAGWKKVAANVSLKQGQYKGKKDTNRMRQAIINKKSDQTN